MNQNCEFRVWSIDKKKFLDPKNVALCADGSMIIFNQYPDDKNSPDGWSRNYLSKQTYVQFWTGVIDSTGKKVFEGDIVEWEDWDDGYGHDNDPIEKGKGTVKWGTHAYNGYTWGWTIENHKDCHSIGLSVRKIKIVGNKMNKSHD